jgi:hypothetical protein
MPAASGGAMRSMRPAAVSVEGDGVAALKALVIGMGVLIVAGTVTLVVLLVQRANVASSPPAARVAAVAPEFRGERGAPELRAESIVLGEPAGSRIGGIAAAGGALAIWVVRPDGDRVVLVDPASGRRSGEIRLRE